MEKTTIEGVEYYAAEQVESLIRSRIAKVSERARTAEGRLEELEGQLGEAQGKIGVSDTLAARVKELEESLSSAEGKYQRHTAISSQGFTDPDVRDLIEWAFDRAKSGSDNADEMKLAEWLSGMKDDPEQAPAALRPHLASLSASAAPATNGKAPKTEPAPSKPIPRSSAGLQPTPGGNMTIDQALTMAQRGDLSAYKQIREGLKSRYSKGNPFSPAKE